jgi:hypothetical protein
VLGPGVALKTRLDSAIGWLPLGVPPKFLPGPISASLVGGKPCTQPKVDVTDAVFSCPVGSLASGPSVQMTVSFQIVGRIGGRNVYEATTAFTGSRDPTMHNNEPSADATMTGCHPAYPGVLCIAPPPPDLAATT